MARRFSATVLFAVPAVLLLGCSSGESEVVAEGSLQAAEPSEAGFVPNLVQGCRPGTYLGDFRGIYDSALGPDRPMLTGEIQFGLELAASGEFLELTTSQIDGELGNNVRFTAEVVQSEPGCTEGRFSSRLVNGRVTNQSQAVVLEFEGTVDGEYNAATSHFDGTWETSLIPSGGIIGSGLWYAFWKHE